MSYFTGLKGKKVLLVSHEITFTGAPLLLAETGVEMAASGAEVFLASLRCKDPTSPPGVYEGLREVEIDDSFAMAAGADLIIANTAVSKSWVRMLLSCNPEAARKLVWWIHEIDLGRYSGNMEYLGRAAAVIFDSECALLLWQQSGLLLPPIALAIHPGVTPNFWSGAMRLQRKKWWESMLGSSNGAQPSVRENVRTALGVNPEDFLITLAGSYCPLKGHDLLVDTVGQMLASSPNLPLKLLLIGFRNKIQKEAFLKKLSARQLAAVETRRVMPSVSDLKSYYLASDAYIMNTQLPGETFGRVSIEAMAFGLPVLATDAGGTREIVVDGATGLLHPPGTEGQSTLSKNILTLLHDRPTARALGKAGFKKVKAEFRAERFYREFARVMDRVVAVKEKAIH